MESGSSYRREGSEVHWETLGEGLWPHVGGSPNLQTAETILVRVETAL